ncbi:MAG: hypothetical protein AB1483_00510 [Candidatus Zixiibacteriota bacterium]
MPGLCLECHKAIEKQQAAGRGLHSSPDYRDCALCHVEHQGRDYELIYFSGGQEAFDHLQTGYALEGAHAGLECRKCHRQQFLSDPRALSEQGSSPERTFLGLERKCVSCHSDQHRGQLGTDCAGCHDFQHWKPAVSFSHDTARFPLTGRHAVVPCAKCHHQVTAADESESAPSVNYRPVAHGTCTDCHRDPHERRLGDDCERCHNTGGWREVRSAEFDHDRTRYPLRGRHASVECGKCHGKESRNGALLFSRCLDCHADFHDGAFADREGGTECGQCHVVEGFSPARFTQSDHDLTRYPLRGAHKAIACSQCHRADSASAKIDRFDFESVRCAGCHRNPHGSQLDRWITAEGCEACHSVEQWSTVSFDHNQTEFALAGKHGAVACIRCHKDESAAAGELVFKPIDTHCETCHTDIHAGQFADIGSDSGSRCVRCHTTDSWRPDNFDHNRDSRFVLEGAHTRVPCAACHRTETVSDDGTALTRYRPLDMTCASCHGTIKEMGRVKL